jgi:Protein of unknown function (DUF3540)
MTAVAKRPLRDHPFEPLSRPTPDTDAPAGAELVSRDGRDVTIRRDGAILEARIAFGCLIQPEPGDHVLTTSDGATTWVLSVLERTSDRPARLWSGGALEIASAEGDITLSATRRLTISAGTGVRVESPEIELHARLGRFVIDELTQIGRQAAYFVARIRNLGEVFETFADHLLVRAKRGTRHIEESDQVRAGSIDHQAEGAMHLYAETTFITADKVVRVDADQIHMG